MMDSLPSTPASLTGLFDGLNQPTARAEPTTMQPPASPDDDDVVHDVGGGDDFSFTLEPGSTVEPEPSPFDAADIDHSFDVDMRAASSRSIGIEFADDVAVSPPPGAGIGLDSGFAEIDPMEFDSPLPEASTPEPLPAFDPFDAGAAPEPGLDFAVEPAVVAATAMVDESDFGDVDFALEADMAESADVVDADDGEIVDGEAAFDALGGLDELDGLPSLDDQAGLDALAELDREIASLNASMPMAELTAPSSAGPMKTQGPTLSSRVGALAESLEEGGRIADAAMLYEVQAVLAAAGR